jgi:hypothetical protein
VPPWPATCERLLLLLLLLLLWCCYRWALYPPAGCDCPSRSVRLREQLQHYQGLLELLTQTH